MLRFLAPRCVARAAAVVSGAALVGAGGSYLQPPSPAFSLSARAPSAIAAASAPSFVRVVSYNVLCSHLCEPDHFIACNPNDLAPSTRVERVKRALQPHIDLGAVICLQEVSVQWIGELTPFFEEAGYTLMTGSYGKEFNNYMGVSLAWPRARFEAEACDVTRAAETKPWPRDMSKGEKPKVGRLLATWQALRGIWWRQSADTGPAFNRPPMDVAKEVERRANMLVSARLRCRTSGKRFAVSTYHMPCLFGSDPAVQVMVCHAALAARHALALADGDPCILAGDFNFDPQSAPYMLLTRGELDDKHPHQPPARAADPWRPTMPMALQSAYVAALGHEPDFTNLAVTKFQPDSSFCGTLDYIFLGDATSKDKWKVNQVRVLPTRDEVLPVTRSYPTATEPSDHVAIWCDLDLVSGKG